MTTYQIVFTCLIFIWTGFVRTGLGFGGGALGIPLMLLVIDQPIFWLPIIGLHLLFFSALTLSKRLQQVDWAYLKKTMVIILPTALMGIFGLLNLPNTLLLIFIYSITLFYALSWVISYQISTSKPWVDNVLLSLGGYIAGTSLTSAPLMVAVYMKHVKKEHLRNTLFVLWFTLVLMKMSAFVVLQVNLHWQLSLALLPVAAIGHVIGLKMHETLIQNDKMFKKIIGVILTLICAIGLSKIGLQT